MRKDLFNNHCLFWLQFIMMFYLMIFVKWLYLESAAKVTDGTKAFEIHFFQMAVMAFLLPIIWRIIDNAMKLLLKKFS